MRRHGVLVSVCHKTGRGEDEWMILLFIYKPRGGKVERMMTSL